MASGKAPDRLAEGPASWDPDAATFFKQIVSKKGFQGWANSVPGLRWFAKRDGAAIFDLVQGFVRSQVLFALVELDLPQRLLQGPVRLDALSKEYDLDPEKLQLLLDAGAAIGIIRKGFGRYSVTRQGAALVGVPGLRDMILHHGALYRDMTDPVALLKGETQTELAKFWPYVFGAEGAGDPETARKYSDLMADTQGLVAQDTMAMVEMRNFRRIMDLGGGSGGFSVALAQADPFVKIDLVDLPAVEAAAKERIEQAGLSDRITFHGLSFRDDPLPEGADAVALIRVLYDHAEETIRPLLRKVYDLLPPRGTLIISEPMAGGDAPDPITDVYFAFYTLAMRTGRTRPPQVIAAMMKEAGFDQVTVLKPLRSYVATAITAVKPAE